MTTDDRMHTLIKGAWARGAATYDLDIGHGALPDRLHGYWLDMLRRLLGTRPLDVVDVGAGTGFLTVLLAELDHHVRGVDLSPDMLAHARERASRAGVQVELAEGEATALPLPDSSADVVISRHVLWTMTDPRAAVAEWMRVARTGGRVVWFDWLGPRGGVEVRGRRWASVAVRAAQRLSVPHEDHSYPAEAYEALPLRGLTDTRAVEAFLLGLGVRDASVQLLAGLAAAERREQPLYRRIEDTSSRYMASFVVTEQVRRALPAPDLQR